MLESCENETTNVEFDERLHAQIVRWEEHLNLLCYCIFL